MKTTLKNFHDFFQLPAIRMILISPFDKSANFVEMSTYLSSRSVVLRCLLWYDDVYSARNKGASYLLM